MLNIIRNLVKSIFGKLLLLVMVASFAVWGMGDLLSSGDSNLVARVGNQKITINDFYNQFQRKLTEFNQSLDKKLTEEEAHKQQITYLVLNEMVYGKLVQEFAEKNSIYISDDLIKKTIISIPQFQDKDGKFNKILFDSAMLSNFNNEAEFTDEISRFFLNNLIFENFSIPLPINDKISNLFYSFEAETRDIIYYNITDKLIKEIYPTDNDTLNYYNDNQAKYFTEKNVKVKYININQNIFSSNNNIIDEQAESYYNDNIENYSKEEMRDIEVINVNSIDQSKKIVELLNNYAELNEYLDEQGLNPTELKNVKVDDFDADLSEIIFSTPEGEISNPIEIDGLGYFAVKIIEIIPAKIESLNEAKDEIVNFLNEENAYNTFLENIELIEEQNLTGSTLDEIATDFNLEVEFTNSKGLLNMLTDDNLNLIFNSETGYQSDLLIENNDETYIVEILNVYDAYLPSYEELKDQVTKDYKNIKTNELLEAKVSDLELAYKYTDEENFVNFANQNGFKIIEKERVERTNNNTFNQQTLNKIFKNKVNSSIMFKDFDDMYGLVFVKKINPADNLINETKKQNLNANIEASFNQSMENLLKNKLGADIEYQLFLKNIDNLFL